MINDNLKKQWKVKEHNHASKNSMKLKITIILMKFDVIFFWPLSSQTFILYFFVFTDLFKNVF